MMRHCQRYLAILTFVIHLCMTQHGYAQSLTNTQEYLLWYKAPAVAWEEALPLGNGQTGAMVFGGIGTERLQLNDNTVWSGYPDHGNNPQAAVLLPKIRSLIFSGAYDSAAKVWKQMQGPYSARYLPLADCWLQFDTDSAVTDYRRSLDLSTAIANVQYRQDGNLIERETFLSHPAKALISRIHSAVAGKLSFAISLSSKLRYKVTRQHDGY
ncbi:MAG: glycoside hydrolase family 95 protein, partial [Sphingobacteriales bacterium]